MGGADQKNAPPISHIIDDPEGDIDGLSLCAVTLINGFPVDDEPRKDMVDLLLVLAHYPDVETSTFISKSLQQHSYPSFLRRILRRGSIRRLWSGQFLK